jgi:hypothetical protein
MKALPLLLTAFLAAFSMGRAETVKDREGAVRNDRAAMEKDDRWIYNDFQAGFEKAKASNKPLLVVLRCVPCLACAGIDASVLTEPELEPLLSQFVCVRVINANALDLSLFQFDYDLSFSTMFFNGDGTIYGRYGSWRHQKDPQDKTTAGYKRALEAALALHRDYPANKSALAGKQGKPTPYKTPVEIPGLAGVYKTALDWDGKVVKSCVHCHQIGEEFRASYRKSGKAMPADLVFPWPQPEVLGLALAPDNPARIQAVAAGSIADKAGLKPEDEIVSLAGQPLISIADVSWVLNYSPDSGALPGIIRRRGNEKAVDISLPSGWRKKTDISRRVGTWGLRGFVTGGLVLQDLADDARASRGLSKDQMALLVTYVGQYGHHAAAKKAGFQKDDVIVELDGKRDRLSEGEMIAEMLSNHRPGDPAKAIVLRGPARLDLSLPMQ